MRTKGPSRKRQYLQKYFCSQWATYTTDKGLSSFTVEGTQWANITTDGGLGTFV